MDYKLYPVVAEYDDQVDAWSILAPDFPEVASQADERHELVQQAHDAVMTAVEVRREDGLALPAETEEPWLLTKDWPPGSMNLLLFVPVATAAPPSEPVRVNVSIDRHLLERIDTEATRLGMTRSAFLSDSAKARLRA